MDYISRMGVRRIRGTAVCHKLQAEHLAMAKDQYKALIDAVKQRLFAMGMAA